MWADFKLFQTIKDYNLNCTVEINSDQKFSFPLRRELTDFSQFEYN